MKSLINLSAALAIFVGVLTACSATSSQFGVSLSNQSNQVLSSVQLNWNSSTGSPSGYLIEQSTNNGVTFTQVLAVPSPTASTATVQVPAGKFYYFRVRSYNQGGDSGYTANYPLNVPLPSPSPSASNQG
jgi:hypothetical protein